MVREDLNRMASRSDTDIVFDEFAEEDFIYRNGKHKGDPEYVIFHIKRDVYKRQRICTLLKYRYRLRNCYQAHVQHQNLILVG